MNKKTIIIFIALILLNIVLLNTAKENSFEVVFFDVGQGDSIFIKSSLSQQILIDGGPDSSVLKKLEQEMPFYDKSLDLIILTHPDHDHLFGLLEVLKRYKVKDILWTGVPKDTEEFKEWERLIREEKARIRIAKAGQKIILPEAEIEIIYPLENFIITEDINDTSIVLKIDSEKDFLLTGDISSDIEKVLVKEYDLKSDILKIAHHGSSSSSCEEFLKEVNPSIAVIQVGENNYGHPSQEVLARLDNFDIQILRTDQFKDIKIK